MAVLRSIRAITLQAVRNELGDEGEPNLERQPRTETRTLAIHLHPITIQQTVSAVRTESGSPRLSAG